MSANPEGFRPVTEFESSGEAIAYIRGRLSALEYTAESIRNQPARQRHHAAGRVRQEVSKLRCAVDALDNMTNK